MKIVSFEVKSGVVSLSRTWNLCAILFGQTNITAMCFLMKITCVPFYWICLSIGVEYDIVSYNIIYNTCICLSVYQMSGYEYPSSYQIRVFLG